MQKLIEENEETKFVIGHCSNRVLREELSSHKNCKPTK